MEIEFIIFIKSYQNFIYKLLQIICFKKIKQHQFLIVKLSFDLLFHHPWLPWLSLFP